MSRLYGVLSHAVICKILKKHKNPFCDCCGKSNNNNVNSNVHVTCRYTDKSTMTLQEFNREIVQFLKDHHLSVYAVEKRIQIDGLSGRVDCIFRENLYKKTLYIIDWKFSKYIPYTLQMEYVIQLNLYMYIMKRIDVFSTYNFQLYCIIFSTTGNNKIKIFKSMVLSEEFLKSLISVMNYK